MKIAVTYENGEVFGHFGHTEQFKLYDAENGKIIAAKALAEGKLEFDPDARCDHHEHHDGDCGHGHCGEHNCEGN